jgi:hypothetical protein
MKIVYFDYWTKGCYNFEAIDTLLKLNKHDTILLHVNSFRSQEEDNCEVNNIKTFEIKELNTIMIYNALKILKPDVIITLNTTGILDRTLVLSARKLKIKTFFLMHGLIPIDEKLENEIKLNTQINNLFYKFKKSIKYLKYYIPNYLFSLYKYDYKLIFKFKWLYVLKSHFSKPYKSMYFPFNTEEVLHDKCLIYSKVFQKYYSDLGYDNQNIVVVGNPTYNELFKKIENATFNYKNLPEKIIEIINNKYSYAVYIDDGLYIYSYDNWDKEYMKFHLLSIAERLQKENTKLVVKIRPSTDIQEIFVDHPNIYFCKDVSFYDLVYYSKFTIGHVSTALNIPVILNKPIVIPGFDKSKNITDYYIKNKVGNLWEKLKSEIPLEINIESRDKYIRDYITILDSKSVERIVNQIENI